MKAVSKLAPVLLTFLLFASVLTQAAAEKTVPDITPTPQPSPTPYTPQTPRPSPTPAVNGLEPLVIYKTDILNPNSSVYYTDLMQLNFTVEWRKNATWVAWIVPHFGYSIDNGSRVEIVYEEFVQGGPYLGWENDKKVETTITTKTIDVSNFTDGTHTLTLYSDTWLAAGQLGSVDCILGTTEFRTGEPLKPWTENVTENIPLIIFCLAIILAVATVAIYLKRKQRKDADAVDLKLS